MTCPAAEKWLLLSLGELSVNEAGELERHRARCASCREGLHECERLLDDLRQPAELELAAEPFVGRVLAACASAPAAPRAGGLRARVLLGGGLAAAAALLLLLPRPAPPADHWTARGGGAQEARTSPNAELFFMRNGALRPLEAAALTSGDGLLVRYENPSPAQAFLLVFALDAAGETHWIYPAYLDPAQDPESIAIAARSERRALSELVEPDAPAQGTFRVFAVFSKRPLKVRAVEARLSQRRGAEVAVGFAGAQVQQWNARWTR